MQSVGYKNINSDTLRNTVMLAEPTLNDHTIFSAILIPALGSLDAIPVKSDYPDISWVHWLILEFHENKLSILIMEFIFKPEYLMLA